MACAPTTAAPPPLPRLELRWTVEATMITVAPLYTRMVPPSWTERQSEKVECSIVICTSPDTCSGPAGANTSGLHRSDRSLKVIPVHPLDAWQARTPEALRSKVPTVALTVLLVLLSEGDSGVPVHVPPEVVPQSVESVPGEQSLSQ